MELDEKALEAAFKAAPDDWNCRKSHLQVIETAIRAYLSALPSSPVSDLVDLRECLDRFVEAFPAAAGYPLIKRGYASLTTFSTRNAELEREVKRLREFVETARDYAREANDDGMYAAADSLLDGGDHE